MQIIELPPLEYLLKCFRYDPKTGRLFWMWRPLSHFKSESDCRRWNSTYAGREAGAVSSQGYRVMSIDSVHVRVSRVIWKIISGDDPAGQIDHANRDTGNHRPNNLRDATPGQNGSNRKVGCNNTSGFKGVTWRKNRERWAVIFGTRRRTCSLGCSRIRPKPHSPIITRH